MLLVDEPLHELFDVGGESAETENLSDEVEEEEEGGAPAMNVCGMANGWYRTGEDGGSLVTGGDDDACKYC